VGRAKPSAVATPAITPQPGPQTSLLKCPIFDVLFGGARGGGKTFGMILDFIEHAATYKELAKGIFFRRIAKNLEDVKDETRLIFPRLGGRWLKGDGTWEFGPGPCEGATLKFRHLWDSVSASAYLGHQYTWMCVEEITQWPHSRPIDEVKATLRSAQGVQVKFRATGNPGGVGHSWVKARYVTPAPRGYVPIENPQTGDLRCFIPSRLEDNPALMEGDPAYQNRVFGHLPPHMKKAWRWGDWDIVAGGFFEDVWVPDRQILPRFEPPLDLRHFRSFDWGSAVPSSLGLWVEWDGRPLPSGRHIPRGSFVRYNEWYAVKRDPQGFAVPNEGLRLTNDQIGQKIAEMSRNRRWSGCVADPSVFVGQGGPSIFKQIKAAAKNHGHILVMREADNSRPAGWQKLRDMLEESSKDPAERPGFYVTENCTDWIRTVPVLTADDKNLEDVDTDQEDHAADETRYAVMHRRRTMTRGKLEL